MPSAAICSCTPIEDSTVKPQRTGFTRRGPACIGQRTQRSASLENPTPSGIRPNVETAGQAPVPYARDAPTSVSKEAGGSQPSGNHAILLAESRTKVSTDTLRRARQYGLEAAEEPDKRKLQPARSCLRLFMSLPSEEAHRKPGKERSGTPAEYQEGGGRGESDLHRRARALRPTHPGG